jgi:MFS family permease
MYIAELSPPAFRGKLVTVNQVCICSGILVGFATGKVFSSWRWMMACGLPVAGLLLLAFIIVTPYSPRWLMTKGREEEARAVLTSIRGVDDGGDAVEAELAAIAETIETARATSVSATLALPWVRWAVIVGVALSFIQQASGVNSVNAYAPDVLSDAGFNTSDSLTMSIYIGLVKLLFVIVALAMMDRLGRRDLLLWGTGGMAVSLGCLAISLTLKAAPMLSAVSLFLYMAFFEVRGTRMVDAEGSDVIAPRAFSPHCSFPCPLSTTSLDPSCYLSQISLGPVMWLLLSELYPLSVRGVAMSIGSTACWLFTVLVTFSFPPLVGAIGASGSFFIFFGVCVLSFIWMWFYIPETKGKSLEEIETMLKEGRIR